MSSLSLPDGAPAAYGHYRLERVIGKGGMAVVYAGKNERTGADVALKVVHRGAYTEEARARFEHEASISGRLEHRNIVRVYDFLKDEAGASVLVMECLRGETLAALLARRQKLDVRETLAIVLPLLAALDHTHRAGIVHRDVKPSNVFIALGSDGEIVPKLLDFGIATRPLVSPQLTAEDEVLGTPRAMSPEQIRGDSVLDGRSDIFSVASVVVEMLTAVPPFGAKTAAASLVAVLEREVDPSPEIPARLYVELERALRKRSYERHPTAKELGACLREVCGPLDDADLDRALLGLEVVDGTRAEPLSPGSPGSPASSLERSPRRGRSRNAIAPLAVGVLLVTATAFALGSRFRKDERTAKELPVATASATVSVNSPSALVSQPTRTDESALAKAVAAPSATSVVAPKGSSRAKAAKPVATRPDF